MSFVYTQLNDQTVVFQIIQFIMSHLFSQFKYQTVLFNPKIGPYQVLPLQARVDLAMNEHSAFPKAPALFEPHHQIV